MISYHSIEYWLSDVTKLVSSIIKLKYDFFVLYSHGLWLWHRIAIRWNSTSIVIDDPVMTLAYFFYLRSSNFILIQLTIQMEHRISSIISRMIIFICPSWTTNQNKCFNLTCCIRTISIYNYKSSYLSQPLKHWPSSYSCMIIQTTQPLKSVWSYEGIKL